jgi:glyoxylase-like metal-dependent hydrolase (beta-lactamase superfamily II)
MNRLSVLVTIAAVGATTLGARAYQGQPAPAGPKVVDAQKLRDNLYMLTGAGGGGNTAVFIATNGVVVVDTKNPGWGQPILDKIKALTPKPVTTIINTHTHGDHVSGNVEFPATVDIVVQDNTKANMEKMAAPVPSGATAAATNVLRTSEGRGMPKRSFKDRMTLGSGNDRIELYYFGRGHTNGDAFVVFPALRAMHAGDIFAGKSLPLLDANNGGSGRDIGDSLAKAADAIKNVDDIITGHSTVMKWADLREYAQFNKDFLAAVQAGVRTGKSVDEIAAGWKIDPKYRDYNVQDARVKTNVQVIVNELK